MKKVAVFNYTDAVGERVPPAVLHVRQQLCWRAIIPFCRAVSFTKPPVSLLSGQLIGSRNGFYSGYRFLRKYRLVGFLGRFLLSSGRQRCLPSTPRGLEREALGGQLPTYQTCGFWDLERERWKVVSQHHASQPGQAELNQVLPVTQPGARQMSRDHYGERVQGGEVEERTTWCVHRLRREAYLKRWGAG